MSVLRRIYRIANIDFWVTADGDLETQFRFGNWGISWDKHPTSETKGSA